MKLPFEYAKNLLNKAFNNDYETLLKALTLRDEQLVLSFKVGTHEEASLNPYLVQTLKNARS